MQKWISHVQFRSLLLSDGSHLGLLCLISFSPLLFAASWPGIFSILTVKSLPVASTSAFRNPGLIYCDVYRSCGIQRCHRRESPVSDLSDLSYSWTSLQSRRNTSFPKQLIYKKVSIVDSRCPTLEMIECFMLPCADQLYKYAICKGAMQKSWRSRSEQPGLPAHGHRLISFMTHCITALVNAQGASTKYLLLHMLHLPVGKYFSV